MFSLARIAAFWLLVWVIGFLPLRAWAGITPTESVQDNSRPPQAKVLDRLVQKPSKAECEQLRTSGQIRRIAFIVGNNRTKNFALQNAIKDAGLIQETLIELGYGVQSLFDADRQAILNSLDYFKEHIKTLCEHDVAVFYYAGNGFEIAGVTYIATPDVEYPKQAETELSVLAHWLRLTDVLARFAHHSGPKVILIDTCRDDPLANQRNPPPPPPGGFRLPPNTLVSYASEPGYQANDIGPNGVNGPYAYSLSKLLKRKSNPLEAIKLFAEVRLEVSKATEGTVLHQWPFVDQTLQQHVYLGAAPKPDGRKALRVETPGNRIALVIGEGAYRHAALPPLENTINDAATLAAKLRSIGFEVRDFYNLGKGRIEAELRAFELRANGAEMALIYYAGHGIERNSSPFIVSVDANLNKDTDIDGAGIAVMPLLEHLRGVRKLGMLILDACRDNPLAQLDSVVGNARNQKVTSGLPPFEINVENVIVAYAAQHGASSYDGHGKNGYFMEAMIEYLGAPGLEVGMLFRKVRDGVLKRTALMDVRQQPWTYSTLPGEPIYLVPEGVKRVARPRATPKN